MIRIHRLFNVECVNKFKFLLGHDVPHPTINPNPISRNYVCMSNSHPMMLVSMNLYDKNYISTLTNNIITSSEINDKLSLYIVDIMKYYSGETVVMSNSDELLQMVEQYFQGQLANSDFDSLHKDTLEYNKNYRIMYPEVPKLIYRNVILD